MSSIQTCGHVIRELRLRHGLTQLQLAELASVSERTIRSAEKSQRISCTHVAYIAEALGVPTIHIVQSLLAPADGNKTSVLHRLWELMFGRESAINLESLLHGEVQIHSCGEVSDFPQSERFFQRYNGIHECVLFFEQISDYLYSLGPIQVSVAELCRCRSAAALQGTVSQISAAGPGNSLRLFSFAILDEGRVKTLVNHIASVVDRDFDLRADSQRASHWRDTDQDVPVRELVHFR